MKRAVSATSVAVLLWSIAGSAPVHAQMDAAAQSLAPTATPDVISLERAFAIAVDKNVDLRVAARRMDAARAQRVQAWSGIVPRLSFGADYTFNYPEQTAALSSQEQLDQQALLFNSIADITAQSAALQQDPVRQRAALAQAEALRQAARDIENSGVQEIVIQPAHVVGANLTLNVPLFNGRALPLLRNAYSGVSIAEIATEQARASILFGVARTYFQVVATKRVVEIATQQRAAAEAHLAIARQRHELQAITDLQLQRAELEALHAEQQTKSAAAGLRAAKSALAGLIDRTEDFDVESPAAVPAVEADAGDVNGLVTRALDARQDIRIAKEALLIAERNRTEAWLRLLPSLNLVAQGRYTSNTSGFTTQPVTGAVIVQAQVPIFDGGQTIGVIQEMGARLEEEELKVHRAQDNIEREVRGALDDIALKRDAADVAARASATAQKSAELADLLFQEGAATAVDVADARVAAYASAVDATRAGFDLEIARMNLAHVLGAFQPDMPAAQAAP